ncbi:MAG: hypothetical protein IH977_11925, partial [Nitrospinae bacterium]|nr:hypothetical protein [Nitrospinota bacterium]
MKSRSCIFVVVALLWASVSFAAESPDLYARLELAQAVSDAGDFVEAKRLFDSVLTTMARDDREALAWAYFGRSYVGHQLSETEELDRERMNAIVDGYRQAWSLDRPV